MPTRVLLLVLASAAALVYANSLANGFAVDDEFIIATNERVHDLGGLRDIWLTPYWPYLGQQFGLYRPLTVFLFAIQWAVGGGEPWVFHAANVLLHVVVTLLLFSLLRLLVPSLPAAVGTLVFAVHPVHTEAVANVVGQAEIVSAAAVLAACLVHATRPPGAAVGWARRAVLAGLFLLALFSKESAVVLPALLIVLDLATGRVPLSRRGLFTYLRAQAVPLTLLAAVFAAYSLVRMDVLEGVFLGVDTGPQLGFLKEHRVLNALRVFPEHLRLLFFPAELSADYNPAVILPVESMTLMAALGLLLLAATVALALLLPWRPALGLPAAWFLIAISPVSNLFIPVGILVAERTLYLPSVAVALLVAFAWRGLSARRDPARLRLLGAAAGAATLLMAAKTWSRNPVWDSTSSLYTSVVRDHPESYRSQWILGAMSQSSGDRARAALHYEAAYRIYPRNSELMTDYAEFLLRDRRFGRAVELLETACHMHPQIIRSASLLVWAYLAAGRYADALPAIERVEQLGGSRSLTMPLRAYAYERLGFPGRSAAAWRIALREQDAQFWRNWSYLARALARAGDISAAERAATRARVLAPDSGARRVVNGLGAAIRSGCYESPPSHPPAHGQASTSPAPASCDSLGDWLSHRGLQTATGSQNARPPRGSGAGQNRG